MIKAVFFFILCLLLSPFLQGQSYLPMEHITTKDGLSYREVNDLLKDRQGFLWIVTADGLNRFDGVNWEVYRQPELGYFYYIGGVTVFNDAPFINNGIMVMANGKAIPNTQNNEIQIFPKSRDCTPVFTNALTLGNPVDFQIASTWYYDASLTQPAGTYNLATNTFSANSGFPIGVDQTVYYSITDATNACARTASQTLHAKDDFAPVFTLVPGDGTVECNNIPPVGTPIAVDNCGGPVTITYLGELETPGTCPVVRTLTRRWRATDQAGHSTSAAQIITVRDQKPPVFSGVPTNTTVECGGVPALASPTASDNCTGPVTITYLGETSAPGACPVLYTLTRSWRASDACGNAAIASQVITVRDTKTPVLLAKAQNQIPECGPDNAAQLQTWLGSNGGAQATDCGAVTWSYANTPGNFDLKSCGEAFKKYIRFTATDQCGNTAYTDAYFIAVDNTPPVFTKAPEDQTIDDMYECNSEDYLCIWLDKNANLEVNDACGAVKKLEKRVASSGKGCGNTWWKRYEFTATDECGNVSKAYATFRAADTHPPTITCPPGAFIQTCIDDLPQPDISAVSAVDNCTASCAVEVDVKIFGSGCVGDPLFANYTYTATDDCGNVATCFQHIQVRDNTASDLVIPDIIQVACVDDIPGPDAVGNYIVNLGAGGCKAKYIFVATDSGLSGNTRTYGVQGLDQCNNVGLVTNVTFEATGTCKPLCTAAIDSWADANAAIGSELCQSVIDSLSNWYGGVKAGALNKTLTIAGSDCFQNLLATGGDLSLIPYGHHLANGANGCGLKSGLLSAGGTLRSELLANILTLQLNIWYNKHFNQRDLGVQYLRTLPDCMIDDAIMAYLGTNATWQDLLSHANAFLGNQGLFFGQPGYAAKLNAALMNLNISYQNCTEGFPCSIIVKPTKGRNADAAGIDDLKLFPNPASDGVELRFMVKTAGMLNIQLTDLSGRPVQSKRFFAEAGPMAFYLNLAEVPGGIYLVQVAASGQFGVEKLMVFRR